MNDHEGLLRLMHDDDMRSEREAMPQLQLWRHPSVEWFEPIVVTRPNRVNIDEGSRIDSFVKLEGGVGLHIGRYVHVASFAHLNLGGGSLTIEDEVLIASGGKVISGGNLPAALSMSSVSTNQERDFCSLRIGRYAAICTNAVLVRANLGVGAMLAAGAVCLKDVPPWEIWGGVPARFLRRRRP